MATGRLGRRFAILGGLLAIAFLGQRAIAENPDVLWHIVHDKCETAVAPCTLVDMQEHFALLKDRTGVAQYLLIPTDKITGVEDPVLLDPKTPNFFADAWAHRDAMQAKLPRHIPRDAISLVVNAQTARSQNQLHIHIDCLSVEARAALKVSAASVGKEWAPLARPVAGHMFVARRVDGETLTGFNPFIEIAKSLADPASDMARHNVVVVGAEFSEGPGFLALTDLGPPIPIGSGGGEEVQDHACAVTGTSTP
jgi:CDP-diacylglycerol pyrophosphatase